MRGKHDTGSLLFSPQGKRVSRISRLAEQSPHPYLFTDSWHRSTFARSPKQDGDQCFKRMRFCESFSSLSGCNPQFPSVFPLNLRQSEKRFWACGTQSSRFAFLPETKTLIGIMRTTFCVVTAVRQTPQEHLMSKLICLAQKQLVVRNPGKIAQTR